MKLRIVISVLLVGVIIAETVIVARDYIPDGIMVKKVSQKQLKAYADQVLDKCSLQKFRPGCYEREIPKLLQFISMEEVFSVTMIVQDVDQEYVYCHILGHNLSYEETKKPR